MPHGGRDIDALTAWLTALLWPPTAAISGWGRHVRGALQVVYMLAQDLAGGMLTLRATGLVYTTLLSLVPLLAVSFSLLKAFGVHYQVEPLLQEFLQPLGPKAPEIVATLIGFVENIDVGLLGALGLATFIYTVVSLVHKIESAFNAIWGVARDRPFFQRFSSYLSVTLFGPVLVMAALGLRASLNSSWVLQRLYAVETLGAIADAAAALLPLVLVIASLTAVYLFLPNTRVRALSALLGGVVAGLAWELTGGLFAAFVAGSTRYTAVYASFAIGVVALIWLYLCWLILLLGSSVALYHQHPERRRPGGVRPLSIEATEAPALRAMAAIGTRFRQGQAPLALDALAAALQVAAVQLAPVLDACERAGLLSRTEAEGAWLPAYAPEAIGLAQVLEAVRGRSPAAQTPAHPPAVHDGVHEVMQRLELARRQALQGESVERLTGAPAHDGEGTTQRGGAGAP